MVFLDLVREGSPITEQVLYEEPSAGFISGSRRDDRKS